MDDDKVGVAVHVASKGKYPGDTAFKDIYAFGGKFANIHEALGYLQYLENRNTGFIVQIGFVGWDKD